MFQTDPYHLQPETAARRKSSERLKAITENETRQVINDTSIISQIDDTGEILRECLLEPQKAFVRGSFIEELEPERLTLLPEKHPTELHDHDRWTRYLSNDLKKAILTNFDENFTTPIVNGVNKIGNELPKQRNYCAAGK